MTLDQFYILSSAFIEVTNKHNLIGPLNNLESNLSNLRAFRGNQSNAQSAQSINGIKAQLDTLKAPVMVAMRAVKIDWQNSIFYGENSYFDNLISDADLNNINALSMNVDLNQGVDLADASLTRIKNIYDFLIYSKKLDGLFTVFNDKASKDQLLIVFKDEAFIDDLKGLSKASDDWNFIVHSFGRLLNENDTKGEILSVTRGSLILTIGAVATIIGVIIHTSNKIMDSVLKALSIKQKILELRKLVVDTDSAELDLIEKKATIKINTLANGITANLMDEHQASLTEGNYKEIEGFVRRSVKKMISFNAKGGKVEPQLISPTTEQKIEIDKIKQLNTAFEKLQDAINQIEKGKNTLLLEGSIDEEEEILGENIKKNEKNSEKNESSSLMDRIQIIRENDAKGDSGGSRKI